MLRRSVTTLSRSNSGAVAPTIALSLFGLIAAGGIAFDYAHLASLDTELQNAADQAALAAATQLDGETGSISRATAAAQNLVTNLTYFANDSGGTDIDVPTVTFYTSYDPATGPSGVTTNDATANYVKVTVETRTANFALTPIVAALSGDAVASALATMDTAYCNLPPFMMCKPTADFDASEHIGDGLRLVTSSGTLAPGNFGFLQTGYGSGANNLAKAVGWNDSAGGCVAAKGVVTEPGDKESVRSSINTRFDMSESGQQCPAGGDCAPSTNVRKDLVHADNGNNCSSSGNQGWSEIGELGRYRAPNTSPLSPTNPMNATNTYPKVMGHPRDLCHAVSEAGTCTYDADHIVGDGNWDRDAYFKVNYNWDGAASGTPEAWTTKTGLASDATRYQVYLWEAANPQPIGSPGFGIGVQRGPFPVPKGKGGGSTDKYTDDVPVCRPETPIAPGNLDTDRRVTAVAVVDCTGLSGRGAVKPREWIDVFLVEPSFTRTENGGGSGVRTDGSDVYVEIIGTRPLPGVNQSIGEVLRRDVPRLIE
ncbi:MAG TPA: pilus assembly protein TadG-related protein [Sphingomicrobium sp.]|nr:pilus assembly protein TadG-related protein [Sphingomicrobium sp.]